MRYCTALLVIIFLAGRPALHAQSCDCAKELSWIKNFMETNYAGFNDKIKERNNGWYKKRTDSLLALAKSYYPEEKCLLIISHYLDGFNDDHIQIRPNFGPIKIDTSYISRNEIVEISPATLSALKNSHGVEGIYNFRFDSSYKIAIIKSKTALRDYAGVLLESKLLQWKRGMLKFEMKPAGGNIYKGILYIRNHLPKPQYYQSAENYFGGDWLRDGAPVNDKAFGEFIPVDARKISNQTFYLKIQSFEPWNAHDIDSVMKLYEAILKSTPNLILDLRGNGGGSDFTFEPLLPYLYTKPVKNIGVDVLATEANINGWKEILNDKDLPEENKNTIKGMISSMEANKGGWVNIADDGIDSGYTVMAYPKKIAILIDNGCASTTEQFLLAAKQSSKVILMGEASSGTLDYSNMRAVDFPCMPYILNYATTRSRRLNIGQGIDVTGIKPKISLSAKADWIKEATKILEK